MDKVICVYSSSSNAIDKAFFEAAGELGGLLARRGDSLLFGGGVTGLMGECARAVHAGGATVIGVIPEALNEKGIVYERCDELVVTRTMRERKAVMDERSDAFIALPGGFGTIEEIMEIITLKQLQYHAKPVILLNVGGYYDALLKQFEVIIGRAFAKPGCMELFLVTDSVTEAFDYIDGYEPDAPRERWLTDVEQPRPSGRPSGAGEPESPDFQYCKLEIFIPETHFQPLREALLSVGAGHIGAYDGCLSVTETTGFWRPLEGSHPYDGEKNILTKAKELKVEVICLKGRTEETIRAVKAVHPYEVPVINAIPLYKTGF